MLELSKYQINARLINEDEKKEFGAFISHSSADTIFVELEHYLLANGIKASVDNSIGVGSEDFAVEIKKMIDKCMCAVIIISETSLRSTWVNYEIGLLEGKKKNIILFDKNNILDDLKNCGYLDKYMPSCKTFEQVLLAIQNQSAFHNLFVNETAELSIDSFNDIVKSKSDIVKISLSIPNIKNFDFSNCEAGYLLDHFGISSANKTDTNFCYQGASPLEEGGKCPVSNCLCAYVDSPKIANNPECVILNKVVYNGYIDKDNELIEFVLPLHKQYGTVFKLILDISNSKKADEFLEILNAAQLSASLSKSIESNRIYISLPNNAFKGIFRLDDEFNDNFMCPGLVRNNI